MYLMIQTTGVQVSADSAISIGLLVVVITATWKLSSLLTSINLKLERFEKLPDRVNQLAERIESLSEDVDLLWAGERTTGDPGALIDRMRSKHRDKNRRSGNES